MKRSLFTLAGCAMALAFLFEGSASAQGLADRHVARSSVPELPRYNAAQSGREVGEMRNLPRVDGQGGGKDGRPRHQSS